MRPQSEGLGSQAAYLIPGRGSWWGYWRRDIRFQPNSIGPKRIQVGLSRALPRSIPAHQFQPNPVKSDRALPSQPRLSYAIPCPANGLPTTSSSRLPQSGPTSSSHGNPSQTMPTEDHFKAESTPAQLTQTQQDAVKHTTNRPCMQQ